MYATNIVDLTAANVREVLLEQSTTKTILIDFWAEWCEPCKQLLPILERIAADYPDTLVLAKVDCETEQELAAQFQIRSVPTLMVFKDGQPVDGMAGAQTEQAIRDMLSKHLPQPGDEALQAAQHALTAEDYEAAYTAAKTALDLAPENNEARMVLADAAARIGHTEQAKELLQPLTMAEQGSPYYQQILATIQLAESAADSPEVRALEEALAKAPNDFALMQQLAVQYHVVKRHQEALELMFKILQADLNYGDARKQTLDMLNNLPSGDPLVAQYRRKLYSMLY
ncbi:thioredoxin [Aliidiomarina quisquiliarum]|uniref:thioredoxin n=1 Tax=Aliidiomarina quisquiliarum TaxID=2938947 RepID=UPI00208EDDD0|nr:thioredoxin [Aliidiomarina quisquiliarum]